MLKPGLDTSMITPAPAVPLNILPLRYQPAPLRNLPSPHSPLLQLTLPLFSLPSGPLLQPLCSPPPHPSGPPQRPLPPPPLAPLTAKNSGWRITFSRKVMLVLMPRMLNSPRARVIFWTALRKSGACAITCRQAARGGAQEVQGHYTFMQKSAFCSDTYLDFVFA